MKMPLSMVKIGFELIEIEYLWDHQCFGILLNANHLKRPGMVQRAEALVSPDATGAHEGAFNSSQENGFWLILRTMMIIEDGAKECILSTRNN